MARYDNTAEDDVDTLIGAKIGDRYLVTDLIGEGGMGSVYRALHEGLAKEVAVKVLRPELCASKRSVARFLREAQTVGSVGHPNIVDVYDVGRTTDGRPYMVMELLRGKDLGFMLEEKLHLAPARVAELLKGPAAALDAMHARGLLHRDIKPENLFVLKRDGVEIVKLVDFGLAAFLDGGSRLTTTGTVCGTPHYMAPEASGGAFPDPRGDVYSLATVAFELIAGRLPFDAAEPMHILAHKLVMDAPRLRDVAPTPVPAAVEALLSRALSRAPGDRPSSASDFVDELAHAAEGSVMVARRTLEIPATFSDRPPLMDDETPLGVPLERHATASFSDRPPPTVQDAFGTPLPRGPSSRGARTRAESPAPGEPLSRSERRIRSSIQPKITPPAMLAEPGREERKTPVLAWIGIAAALLAFAIGAAVIVLLSMAGDEPVAVTELAPRATDTIADERPAEVVEPPRIERASEPTVEPDEPSMIEMVPVPSMVERARVEGAMVAPPVEPSIPEPPPPEPVIAEPAMVETAMTEPEVAAPDGPRVDADGASALTREGNDLALRGRLPEAIEKYRQATLRAPRYAAAWRGLGIANERMGRVPEARRAFQRYLEIAPSAPDAERIRSRIDGL